MAKKKDTSSGSSSRKSYGIRLDPDLVRGIKIIAAKTDKPVNRVLEEAIVEYLKKHREI
jgi:predicted transcriptional regulator